MAHTVTAEQWLPFPLPLVFRFFADPENLPRLMPRWQHARIEQATFSPPPPAPREMPRSPGVVAGRGTRMTLSFRAAPFVPVRLFWDAEITEFAWDDHFCDVIAGRGPFSSWRHCHRLHAADRPGDSRASPVSGTTLRDEVEYALPLGALGSLANTLVVRHQLAAMFRYRQRRTAALLPVFAAQMQSG